MQKEFMPYYVSRAGISFSFSLLVLGVGWQALGMGLLVFGAFLLYAHGGWFVVDLSHPYFPLRRDQHAQAIQRYALIAAIFLGLLAYLLGNHFSLPAKFPLMIGVLAYFIVQIGSFLKS